MSEPSEERDLAVARRHGRIAAVVALLAVPFLYGFVVGAVVVAEVHDQHGHAADNLVFDDHAISRAMSLPLSRVVDLAVPAPADADESLGHFELRGAGYAVAAFVDALLLTLLCVVVLAGIRRVVRRR